MSEAGGELEFASLCHYRTASLQRVVTGLFFTSSFESQQYSSEPFSTHQDHVCAAGCCWHGFAVQGQGANAAALAEAPE